MSRLSDMLNPTGDGDGLPDDLRQLWAQTQAAAELKPLPAGQYTASLERVELASSSRGTPAARLVFRVIDGEHAGRRLRHDCWLTPHALAYSKRDLGKLGISDLGQLGRPLPATVICKLRVSMRRDDVGQEYNRITNFEVARVDPLPSPERDPFAPDGSGEATEPPANNNEVPF